MNILITGLRGFIAHHLARELTEHGHRVTGLDRQDDPAHDLLDPEVMERTLRYAGVKGEPIDLVCHLAAKVGRLHGERGACETVRANSEITTSVAIACGRAGVRLAYASTSEVYGDQGDTMCDEYGPLALPHNIYGVSKRWGEEACQLYAPNRLTIWRLSMPYGPGHPPGRGRAALTNFLWQAHTRQPIIVHRGGERSWCWVGDTVRGLRLTLENTTGGVFNVGRDDNSLPMETVAEMACELTGAPTSLIRLVDPPGAQTVVKRLATQRLRDLGWQPQVDLHEGMRRTYEWLLQHDREEHLIAA